MASTSSSERTCTSLIYSHLSPCRIATSIFKTPHLLLALSNFLERDSRFFSAASISVGERGEEEEEGVVREEPGADLESGRGVVVWRGEGSGTRESGDRNSDKGEDNKEKFKLGRKTSSTSGDNWLGLSSVKNVARILWRGSELGRDIEDMSPEVTFEGGELSRDKTRVGVPSSGVEVWIITDGRLTWRSWLSSSLAEICLASTRSKTWLEFWGVWPRVLLTLSSVLEISVDLSNSKQWGGVTSTIG